MHITEWQIQRRAKKQEKAIWFTAAVVVVVALVAGTGYMMYAAEPMREGRKRVLEMERRVVEEERRLSEKLRKARSLVKMIEA